MNETKGMGDRLLAAMASQEETRSLIDHFSQVVAYEVIDEAMKKKDGLDVARKTLRTLGMNALIDVVGKVQSAAEFCRPASEKTRIEYMETYRKHVAARIEHWLAS